MQKSDDKITLIHLGLKITIQLHLKECTFCTVRSLTSRLETDYYKSFLYELLLFFIGEAYCDKMMQCISPHIECKYQHEDLSSCFKGTDNLLALYCMMSTKWSYTQYKFCSICCKIFIACVTILWITSHI